MDLVWLQELAGEAGAVASSVMLSGKQYLFNNMFRLFSNTLISSVAVARRQ